MHTILPEYIVLLENVQQNRNFLIVPEQNVALAKHFELLIREDERFEIPAKRHLGMVVFRLKGQNELTENLLKRLNSTG